MMFVRGAPVRWCAVPIVLICGLLMVGGARTATGHPASADTILAFTDTPLRQVLQEVEAQTGIRFLYRDALVAGVQLSIQGEGADLLRALRTALEQRGLRLEVDRERRQAIVTRASTGRRSPAVLTGQIVDAASGTRLPLATLTWTEEGRRQGVASGREGTFRLPLDGTLSTRSSLTLTVSYVGYVAQEVRIDPQSPPPELTVRLTSAQTRAPEVLVQSYALQSPLDTTWQRLIRPERTAALGESSVLRALQPLPAVGVTPALVEGLNVRGSRSDGFRVLLDGIPVYNQNHLFGLFDAFNAEALQAVGLYYGVAPVDYQAPPGGTVAFRTRAGSQTEVRGTVEGSPTAVSGTVEGPLAGGQGSWLVSARHSTLGLDWFGNTTLIEQGLGIDQRTASLPGAGQEVEDILFKTELPSARFFDLHGKGLWETDAGGRWELSAYIGGDRAEQEGAQLQRDPSLTFRELRTRDFVDTSAVATGHRWGTLGASLQWHRAVGDRTFSTVTAAVSRYYGRFSTDHFLYVRLDNEEDSRFRYGTFSHDNVLSEVAFTHRLSHVPASSGEWTVGYAASLYDVVYDEMSALADPFRGTQKSVQVDLFAQYDRSVGAVDLQAGLRTHYYTQGAYLRLSPRLQAHLWPDQPITLGVGYTRNHQFLHRLHLVREVSSAVWVPSTEAQPPGAVDHLMAGLSVRPASGTAVQLDAYWKHHENLRRHSTLAGLRSQAPTVLLQPWTVRNTARAWGIEGLVHRAVGAVSWTGAYTLSRVEIDPVGPVGGQPADWDRRHQVTSRVEWRASPRTTVYATWSYASGAPNPYAALPAEDERLDPYHRLDLGVTAAFDTGPVEWSFRGSVFNVYERNNPRHRTAKGVVRPDGADPNPRPDLDFVLIDVYDLGVRPSFSVSAAW